MPGRPLLLLAAALLLAPGCGDDSAAARVEAHPAVLVGRYEARPEHFREEVVAAMRYELREILEGDDPSAAEALQRHLDLSSEAWCKALASILVLKSTGVLEWRLKEPLTASALHGIRLVDLPAPSIDALYGGTWQQTAPGEIEVVFTSRNGRPLRWTSEGRARVRPDRGLDISWSRDLEMSIEEAPLLRASP